MSGASRPGPARIGRTRTDGARATTAPVILRSKQPTIGDFCDRIHKTFRAQFRSAWVWGTSVKHQPQRVGLNHVLHDEDVVQVVKKS